jgi:hypothetical protein
MHIGITLLGIWLLWLFFDAVKSVREDKSLILSHTAETDVSWSVDQ